MAQTPRAPRTTNRPKYSRKLNPEGRMGLADHLVEFRNRFLICLGAIVVAMVAGFILSSPALEVIRQPIETLSSERGARVSINFSNVTTAFDLRMQIALTLGVVIAAPVWLYQLWMFLMPGLKKTERRYAIGFLAAAIPLFLGGVIVGFLVMPRIVQVMTSFAPTEDTVFYDAKTYYSFVLKLCIAVGVAFIVPVILVMLNFAGVLSGRAILGAWRWAIVLSAAFGAIATPAADVMSMFLLMVPMLGLYYLAAGAALFNDRRRARRQAKLLAEYGLDAPDSAARSAPAGELAP